MEHPKYYWLYYLGYTIMSIWTTGCTNHKLNSPIINLVNKNNICSFDNRTVCSSHVICRHSSISNKNLLNISKGSYYGRTYKVKKGDTLFYISRITGKHYLHLAKINNIKKPYILNIGQILKVNNKTILLSNNTDKNSIEIFNKKNRTENIIPICSIKSQFNSNLNFFKKEKYIKSTKKNNTKEILPLLKKKFFSNSNINKSKSILVGSSFERSINNWNWPTYGKIIENFSSIEGGNKGIDISGSHGQKIVASSSGKVVYTGNALHGYGNLIIIKHNDHYLSAYAHNDTILVREQNKVKIGQKIATMGKTGTNLVKLHFEIRYKGKSINPLNYLPPK